MACFDVVIQPYMLVRILHPMWCTTAVSQR